ncbi:MAG TPA: hypothetical protein VEZ16_00225 [Microvirga sp.]|nr:hypothetical protein [Microvirga sp.]
MTTYARQVEVLKITDEQALEGFFYFARVREEKADKYKDYVEARQAASATLRQLAAMEKAFGTEKVRDWLKDAVERAGQEGGGMTIDAFEQHEGAFEQWRQDSKPVATGNRITVSDHAMLRYLERACGMEIEAMREELAGILSAIVPAGQEMIDRDGLRFVIRDGILATVYVPKRHKKAARTAKETGDV